MPGEYAEATTGGTTTTTTEKAEAIKEKAINAEKKVVSKIMDVEHRLTADGACCAAFPAHIGAYAKQLHGCMQHHHISAEEKTGVMWCKAADKGCGSFGSSHHAFLAWLTLDVWLEAIFGAVLFVVTLLEDGVVANVENAASVGDARVAPIDILISVSIHVGFCYVC